MLRKLLKWGGIAVGGVLLAIGALIAYAEHNVNRTYDWPVPNIVAATTPEALVRGEKIFSSHCAGCHIAPNDSLPAGGKMEDVPAFLGEMIPSNLTSDRVAGAGALSDKDLVRKICYGIGHDGKMGMMGASHMGDDDIAAVIGFMRSGSPLFRPVSRKQRPTHLTPMGAVMITMAGSLDVDRRTGKIPVPKVAPTAEYGAYLANDIIGCADCHTSGFAPVAKKLKQQNAYAGGFEFGNGESVLHSANITPDPATGIGKWTEEQFANSIRNGFTPESTVVRPPMPRFRYFDDVDCQALYAYLRTIHAVRTQPIPGDKPRKRASPSAPASEMFVSMGCVSCHGEGRPYREKLKQCATKSIPETAAWILHPEKIKPGTQMPTFAFLFGQQQADDLARFAHAEAEKIK